MGSQQMANVAENNDKSWVWNALEWTENRSAGVPPNGTYYRDYFAFAFFARGFGMKLAHSN